MTELIRKAMESAREHHLRYFEIICSLADYNEVKAICDSNFPQVRVRWAEAVQKGRIYLWDGEENE